MVFTAGNGFSLTHGHTSGGKPSATYRTWASMKSRCYCRRDSAFRRYGAHGIGVCERWHKFEAFLEDMGVRPPGATLDRIDNEKDYSKDNCRWATRKEQARNRRCMKYITINGVTKLRIEWAEDRGIDPELVAERVRLGWTEAEALGIPRYGWRKKWQT